MQLGLDFHPSNLELRSITFNGTDQIQQYQINGFSVSVPEHTEYKRLYFKEKERERAWHDVSSDMKNLHKSSSTCVYIFSYK